MSFHGDLSSFPLPELLQWVDGSRKTGVLQLQWQGGERKLFLLNGQVVATSSPGLWERIARLLALAHLARGEAVMAAFAEMKKTASQAAAFEARKLNPSMPPELAAEELYGTVADLIVAQNGTFHWTEDADRGGDEWVPLELSVRHLLFESLRWVDEQPDVERALPSDSLIVRARVKPTEDLPLVQRVLLTLTEKGVSLGRLRLALGASRAAAARRVYDLLRAKRVQVEGAPSLEVDPIVEMLEKGAMLVRERQFEASGMVFSALLSSDPADRRVREFARMVEREHIAALYTDLPPIFVPKLVEDPEMMSLLRPEERHVASLVNGSWDVSTIVLASHNRELETLKCLSKLLRMGLLVSA